VFARRFLPRLIWLLALACPISNCYAEDLAILLSGADGVYREVRDAIEAEVAKDSDVRVVVDVVGTQSAPEVAAGNHLLLIAVGTRAAELVLRPGQLRAPVLVLLVPRNTLLNLTARLDGSETRRVTAVFLDQPFVRQIELIRQVFPNLTQLGAVVGPESGREVERLRTIAAARGIKLVAERAEIQTELFSVLQRIMSAAEAFLAIPDAKLVNADTAQNLLLTSFRFRTPVIGYSAAYVRAGALAAVYSTPQQAGKEGGEIARAVLKGSALPASRYPRAFRVGVNRHMAATLGLVVADEETLKDRIQRGEIE